MSSFDTATLSSSSLKSTLLNLNMYPFSLKIFVYIYVCMHFCCHSVTKSCPILCDLTNCSMPGFPVLQYFLEFAQSHIPRVNIATQPSYPLSSPSPPALLSLDIKKKKKGICPFPPETWPVNVKRVRKETGGFMRSK